MAKSEKEKQRIEKRIKNSELKALLEKVDPEYVQKTVIRKSSSHAKA
ncbi:MULTISPECIES: hypothetical protein [Gammaproteobacteria]|uniref:Uncharacterized protein n=1 Tax=Marinobacter salarius TaxID=1420917 RepID=A0ABY1FQ82_9GAMM|nr:MULTISPECIES: hypothetical protein [Gammaproteobacteria]MDC9611601.1 hypothetical protein [Pseudoalteromonas sp. GABNS16H]SFL84250.1 hypothetical protein SAMN04487868_1128 [Marinobacter salarius]